MLATLTPFWLGVIALGSPAVGVLLARWLNSDDDVGRPMRDHRNALAVLADLTRDRSDAS